MIKKEMIKKEISNNDIIIYFEKKLEQAIREMNDCSFDLGLPGVAIFYYYKYLYTQNEKYYDFYIELIEKNIKTLSSISKKNFNIKYRTDSIDSHLSGFGRFLIFSKTKLNQGFDFGEILNYLDDILIPLMHSKIKIKDFDINSGAFASGLYILARYKQTKDLKYAKELEALVEGLNESAIEHNSGIYWHSPSLDKEVYLGLSHGSAMIINFLSEVFKNGLSINKAKILIQDAVNFVLYNKREQINGIFPICYYAENPLEISETQFSQCYGDLGIGYALLKSGKVLKDERIYDSGLEVLLECAKRKKSKHTEDASIVYGASGLACLFDEIFSIDKNILFKEASNYWYETIRTYLTQNDNGKMSIKLRIPKNDVNWFCSFGWGISGIGTTLIRFSDKSKYPSFNELLMVGP